MERDNKTTANKPMTQVDSERRRLSKTAAASPILASLASPSVWGVVCSVSGLQSGNTSINHDDDQCTGRGCTPGYWKNHPNVWPAGFSPGNCVEVQGNKCKSWSYDSATQISEILDGESVSVFAETFTGGDPIVNSDAIMKILVDLGGTEGNKGSAKAKIAHYVAAVYNSITAPDAYGTNLADLLDAFHTAIAGTGGYTLNDLMDVLTNMNESGECFISGGSGNSTPSCGELNGVQYLWHEESNTCIPTCDSGYAFDWATKTCVPSGSQTSYSDWCTANPDEPECA